MFSEHPLAAAVVEAADRSRVQRPAATNFKAIPAKGVEGMVGTKVYRVGRPEWIQELGIQFPTSLQTGLAAAESRGESVIALMDETSVLAMLALADQVREQARKAVGQLKAMGIQVVMITGDAEAVAQTVAAKLGIDRYHARVLPQDKAQIVRSLKEAPTAFVGDGINDAPGLLEADLGIAIGAGTNVAIESADLVLIEDDP